MKDKLIIHSITRLDVGGAQEHLFQLITNIDDSNRHIVITGRSGRWLKRFREAGITTVINPFLIRQINPLMDFLSLLFNIMLLADMAERSRIVMHSNAPKAGLVFRWSAFFAGIKNNLFTIHGWDFYRAQNPAVKYIIINIEKITEKITEHFISVCRANVDIAEEHGLRIRHKTSVIYQGFDISEYHTIQPKKNIQTIGTVTNCKPMKHTDIFLAIAEKLLKKYPELRFHVIGGGQRCSKYKKITSSNRVLKENIQFIDYTDSTADEIAKTDIIVSTSYWEGMPRSLIEAYLCDIPFIAFDAGGIYELAELAAIEHLIIDNFSTDSMIKKLSELIEGKPVNMRKNYSIFSIDEFIQKHRKVYNMLK